MKKNIVLSREFKARLQDLGVVLVEKGYFSSLRYAKTFIRDLAYYIRRNAAISPKKPAPAVFRRYGENLLYFTYNRSAQTTWYIFLEETETTYWIRHITNSQIAGQYFNEEN